MRHRERIAARIAALLGDADGPGTDGTEAAIIELVSAEAEALVSADRGPGDLVSALLDVGLNDIVPLAAERHHHAAEVALDEAVRASLAERTPITAVGKALVVAPVGPLGPEGLNRVCDRALAAVLRSPPREVRLVLAGLDPEERSSSVWRVLATDLEAQGLRLITDPAG
jgi:hypothetical protein